MFYENSTHFGPANSILFCLRVTVTGSLILGGGAMAFVADKSIATNRKKRDCPK
jgi:hypothetical protein